MTDAKDNETNRWTIVLGGVMINLMLGVTYTWSVFGSALQNTFGWAKPDQMLAFSIMLLFFGISMPLAGRIQDRKGPKIALIGGLLLGAGFILSGLLGIQNNIVMYATYGVLAGCGVGFAYNSPIAAGNKWFPDKRGLVAGLMVFGFGFGSVLLAPMAEVMIAGMPQNPTGLVQPLIADVFRLPGFSSVAGIGLESTFIVLGAMFLVVISAGAMLLKNPPAGYKPKDWEGPKSTSKNAQSTRDYTAKEMVKTAQFWMIWIMFAFSAAAGLMVIGFLKNFAALSFETAHGMPADAAALEGAIAVSVLAIFNGVGRIFAGWLSDHLGRTRTMFAMFGLQAALISTLVYTAASSPLAVYVVMALIGICFGANFSLFPATTADFFGTKNCGVNYGFVFTAYGAGGILGPMLAAQLVPAAATIADYGTTTYIIGALVGMAAVMALFTRTPGEGRKECD